MATASAGLNPGRNERYDFNQTYRVVDVALLADLAEFDAASLKSDGTIYFSLDVQIIDVECALEARAGLRNERANPFRPGFHPVLGDRYPGQQDHRGGSNPEPGASRLYSLHFQFHFNLSHEYFSLE